MPKSDQLYQKYLPEIYSSHIIWIKNNSIGKNISLIIDESSDILGRPAVNTFVSFYDDINNSKKVLLLDSSVVNANNSLEKCKVLEIITKKTDLMS